MLTFACNSHCQQRLARTHPKPAMRQCRLLRSIDCSSVLQQRALDPTQLVDRRLFHHFLCRFHFSLRPLIQIPIPRLWFSTVHLVPAEVVRNTLPLAEYTQTFSQGPAFAYDTLIRWCKLVWHEPISNPVEYSLLGVSQNRQAQPFNGLRRVVANN